MLSFLIGVYLPLLGKKHPLLEATTQLRDFHASLATELKKRCTSTASLAAIFNSFDQEQAMKLYREFFKYSVPINQKITVGKDTGKFGRRVYRKLWQKSEQLKRDALNSNDVALDALFILPVQRAIRYVMLLTSILEHTSHNHQARTNLAQAAKAMTDGTVQVNMISDEITQAITTRVGPIGRLLKRIRPLTFTFVLSYFLVQMFALL
jgi:hypothetical protein